ncbi:hypothetical protein [Streptomyces sp. NPDC004267]|uniref:hypothetical protein n=1 Tax=Streptomyces sp. NPDC004267 TaxID=3364694 RepID=UPI0036D004E1
MATLDYLLSKAASGGHLEDVRPGGKGGYLRARWVGMPTRLFALSGDLCTIVVASYHASDFIDGVVLDPARWGRFCSDFVSICESLSPLAALAFSIPSDDVILDALRCEIPAAEGDGAWLKAQTYALLYLRRDLDLDAQLEFPELAGEGYVTAARGRIVAGSDFPPLTVEGS